jgi:hypothetical protein
MASPVSSPPANAHHGLAAHEVVLLLETNPHRGLNGEEAKRRLVILRALVERVGRHQEPMPVNAGDPHVVDGAIRAF